MGEFTLDNQAKSGIITVTKEKQYEEKQNKNTERQRNAKS